MKKVTTTSKKTSRLAYTNHFTIVRKAPVKKTAKSAALVTDQKHIIACGVMHFETILDRADGTLLEHVKAVSHSMSYGDWYDCDYDFVAGNDDENGLKIFLRAANLVILFLNETLGGLTKAEWLKEFKAFARHHVHLV
jgi:hypothetical protein